MSVITASLCSFIWLPPRQIKAPAFRGRNTETVAVQKLLHTLHTTYIVACSELQRALPFSRDVTLEPLMRSHFACARSQRCECFGPDQHRHSRALRRFVVIEFIVEPVCYLFSFFSVLFQRFFLCLPRNRREEHQEDEYAISSKR